MLSQTVSTLFPFQGTRSPQEREEDFLFRLLRETLMAPCDPSFLCIRISFFRSDATCWDRFLPQCVTSSLGNSLAGFLPNAEYRFCFMYTAKSSDAYSERIILAGRPPPPVAFNSLAIWYRKMNCAPKK
jgi:hypothetical protein